MQRIMTKTLSDRFQKDQIKDLPLQTWNHIAAQKGVPLGSFCIPIDEINHVESTQKPRGRPPKNEK